MREREGEAETQAEGEAETQAEGEAGPCREPDMGLDPGSPGSRPGLQAALNRCATGAALFCFFKRFIYLFMKERETDRHRQREKQAP